MRKRAFSLLLAMVMCLALLPATASALSNDTFEYTLSGDEVYITGLLDETIEDLVIPSTIDGKPVTQIEGFANIKALKSVTIPSTVKKIGWKAFYRCSSLNSVTLSEGLEEIDTWAFTNCGFEQITLPNSVCKMGSWVFEECENLEKVNIPSSLTTLPDWMFKRCSSLKHIDIPSTVTTIGKGAFQESGLVSITIPSSVTKVPSQMCYYCKHLTSVELPSGVTEIGGMAFDSCTALESILFPTSLKTMDGAAFRSSGLKEVILPYGFESHVYNLFYDCKNLTAIYAPSTMKAKTYNNNVPKNCIVYCMPDSKVAKSLAEEGKVSYQTDASCDTRINVIYNGKRISFGAYGQNPEIINSRTMVPLRSIFEAMGAEIAWDAATQTVTATRGSDKIVMTVGQLDYTVNGVAKTMDIGPSILNSRTMVPVRVVAESFGADVTWHAPSATVIINE